MTILILLIAQSCTDNERARKYGGTEIVTIPKNERFVNISWKESDLWIITQDTLTQEFHVREKSSMGLMEGELKIVNAEK